MYNQCPECGYDIDENCLCPRFKDQHGKSALSDQQRVTLLNLQKVAVQTYQEHKTERARYQLPVCKCRMCEVVRDQNLTAE